jgi:LPXTG-site transpeptidase (sortase) family protein
LQTFRSKRTRAILSWALVAFSAAGAGVSASAMSLVAYDALHSPAPAERAPIDLLALGLDPGPPYDRRPVTPSPSPIPTPSPPPTPAPTPAAAGSGYVQTPYMAPGEERYRLVIDSVGVNAPVVAAYTDANGVPQVPHNGYQVAWYVSTAAPGTGDNAVFAAHVTWNGVAVFYNLHLINVGDQIRIDGNDGTRLVYSVTDSFLVDQNDPNSIQVMRSTGYDAITLISCDGAFFNDGRFGDYTNRRVIRAALTEKYLATEAQPANGP